MAINTLRQLSYDICFFSVTGVSDTGEMTVVSEEFGMLLQEVFKRSQKSVCLCIDSKFGKSEFFSIGTLDAITHIISNAPFHNKLISQYKRAEFIVADI